MSSPQQTNNNTPSQPATASPNDMARYGQELPPDVEAELQLVSDRFDALHEQLRAERGQRWANLGLEISPMLYYQRWVEVDATDDEDDEDDAHDDDDNSDNDGDDGDGVGVLITDPDVEDNDEEEEDFTTIDHTDFDDQGHTRWDTIQDHHPELGVLGEELQNEPREEESEKGNTAESSTIRTHNHRVPFANVDPDDEVAQMFITDPRSRRVIAQELRVSYELGRIDWVTYEALHHVLMATSADLFAKEDSDVDLDEEDQGGLVDDDGHEEEEDSPPTPMGPGPTEYEQRFRQLSGELHSPNGPKSEDAADDDDEEMPQLERVSSTSTVHRYYSPYFLEDGHPDLEEEEDDSYYEGGNMYEDDEDNGEDGYGEEVSQLQRMSSIPTVLCLYAPSFEDSFSHLEDQDDSYYEADVGEDNDDDSQNTDQEQDDLDEQQDSQPANATEDDEDENSAAPKPQEIDVSHIDFSKHHDRLDWRAYTIYVPPEPARDKKSPSLYAIFVFGFFVSMFSPYSFPPLLIAVILLVCY